MKVFDSLQCTLYALALTTLEKIKFKKIALLIATTLPLMFTAFGLTGCACGILSDGWGSSERCSRQQQAAADYREQQSQRELPALKKRADSGDMKAQVAMGNFHIFEYHPNSDRASGLAYYEKAGKQGDLQALRIFLTESHKDCSLKARKLGKKELDGPQYAPHCVAEWTALETLAAKACVRTSLSNSDSGIQSLVAKTLDASGKSDDADFWYVVAMTYCLTAEEHAYSKTYGFVANPRGEGRPQEVRGAMWLGVGGRHRFPNLPLGTPEVEEKAKARLAMLRAKVASSGIRPAL
jgi:hypothetical protein